MFARLASQAYQSLTNIENNILFSFIGRRYPPDAFCVVSNDNSTITNRTSEAPPLSLEELLKDSILWAVPKHRRTVEKRLSRKFGWPKLVWKPIVPKKNLFMCRSCGDHHVAGHLCPTCYSKVKKETEEMHKEIEAVLGVDPVDKEVVVLYQGEKEGVPDEFFKGKRIIEMKKERPAWFSKNLLERTTRGPASTTSVEPKDLA
uniref:Large ribosomal subunit protein bL32m n=1 Tax=Graphocephala atropunctata TaxID=36148 RepID=A0A1B6LYK9_9HEMI